MAGEIIVWDSSVLIPLVLPRSKSSALYARLDRAGWSVAATPAILHEVREKLETKPTLRRWLDLSDAEIASFANSVLPALVRIYPGIVTATGSVPTDANDDHIIAATIESQSKYIVTEDRHLLSLSIYGQIQILSRDAFRNELDRLGVS
jgi:predicted nucleic acid-binding protein